MCWCMQEGKYGRQRVRSACRGHRNLHVKLIWGPCGEKSKSLKLLPCWQQIILWQVTWWHFSRLCAFKEMCLSCLWLWGFELRVRLTHLTQPPFWLGDHAAPNPEKLLSESGHGSFVPQFRRAHNRRARRVQRTGAVSHLRTGAFSWRRRELSSWKRS